MLDKYNINNPYSVYGIGQGKSLHEFENENGEIDEDAEELFDTIVSRNNYYCHDAEPFESFEESFLFFENKKQIIKRIC